MRRMTNAERRARDVVPVFRVTHLPGDQCRLTETGESVSGGKLVSSYGSIVMAVEAEGAYEFDLVF